jgi:ribonuclease-3
LSPSDVFERAQQILNYRFKDPSLLEAALTHASVADHRLLSNERLEFLGDSVLGFVVCEELFQRYPDYLEGDLTKVKSAVVSRKTCARISEDLDLTSLLFLGKGMHGRGMLPDSLAAAVFESLIAAIYLDSGFETVKAFILEHVSAHIDDAVDSKHQRNYKSQLQQHAQKELSATPLYEVLDEKGPDHSKCFEVCVTMNGRRFRSAWGPSKKDAEQKAAQFALEELEVLHPARSAPAVLEPGGASGG